MPNFTYDQFRQEAERSGLLGEFSAADLQLAQRNPNAGMSLLNYKRDWHNATTDAERNLANLGAEGIRTSYGNYTGGGDGSSFYQEWMSPNMFEYASAPEYTSQYNGQMGDLLDQMINYGQFTYGEAPEYTSRYDDTIQDLIGQILNNPDFSWSAETDPLYGEYRKQYIREGQRATEDALGAAAAASGGLPSSYAQTAAGQAANYYNAQLTDMIPQLYQLAYDRYLNDYQMLLSDLGVVQGAEANDYNMYLTDLQQYNTDRNFDYGAWLDRYNMLSNNLSQSAALDDLAFNRYLAELDQYNADRNFAYGQYLDEINSQTNQRGEYVDMAQLAAQYGDLRYLQDLGIDTSRLTASSGYSGGYSGGGGGGGRDDDAGGNGGTPSISAEQSSANANDLMNYISRIPGLTNENRASMIVSAINNGEITEADAQRIANAMGIDI